MCKVNSVQSKCVLYYIRKMYTNGIFSCPATCKGFPTKLGHHYSWGSVAHIWLVALHMNYVVLTTVTEHTKSNTERMFSLLALVAS